MTCVCVCVCMSGESYFGTSLVQLVSARAWWLISLLMLQSLSSVILTRFSALIEVRARVHRECSCHARPLAG